jgi:methylamine dehydrogenase accessory protein MauD
MIVWTAVNSVAIVLVMLALYLTVRQVGLLLSHLGPGGARTSNLGPRIGENISVHTAEVSGVDVKRSEPTLYIFAAQFCPACALVREAAQVIAKSWQSSARLIMVYDAVPASANGKYLGPGNFIVTAHATLREKLDVRAVPYAVMTQGDGTVVGHGLVNNASHIESLLEMTGSAVASPTPQEAAEGALPQPVDNQRERMHA